jgi:hypothetical protein
MSDSEYKIKDKIDFVETKNCKVDEDKTSNGLSNSTKSIARIRRSPRGRRTRISRGRGLPLGPTFSF